VTKERLVAHEPLAWAAVGSLARRVLPLFSIFATVGAIGTGVHYSILILLVRGFEVDAVVGALFGVVAGALVNFVLNHHVTFRSRARYVETAPRFFLIAATGVFLNTGVMYILVHQLGLHYLISQLSATAAILILNFAASALWAFRQGSPERVG
jgi:putative flippase GtrA